MILAEPVVIKIEVSLTMNMDVLASDRKAQKLFSKGQFTVSISAVSCTMLQSLVQKKEKH